MSTITKDTPIIDAVRSSKNAMAIFARYGLSGCAMCHLRDEETIGQGADVHGINAQALVDELNKAIAEENNA